MTAYAGITGFAAYLRFEQELPGSRFYPMLALSICFVAGALWMARCGWRRPSDGPDVPPAAAWPRGNLAIALLVALTLHVMTFWNLDLAVRQTLSGLRAEAGAHEVDDAAHLRGGGIRPFTGRVRGHAAGERERPAPSLLMSSATRVAGT